jgi:hypothetical protein
MRWSFEVPFNYLQMFDKYQDYLFVLSQYLNDRRYYEYVKSSNKLKIFDNGANESEFVSINELIKEGRELGADIIVIPDKQFDYLITRRMFINSIELIKNLNALDEFQYMGVVQGKNIDELLKIENEMIDSGYISYLGLPFKYVLEWGEEIIDKIVNNSPIPVHFLGLGSLKQVETFKNHPLVSTIDTSLPTNYAYLNSRIDKYYRPSPGKIKLASIEHLDEKQLDLLKKNIEDLKGL